MNGKTLLGTALTVSAALMLLSPLYAYLHPDVTRPNYQIFPEMYYSVANEAFSENLLFADGLGMRRPPEGTIARGQEPFPFDASLESGALAGEILRNPFAPNAANLERGRFIFENYCIQCHGPGGKGDGMVVQRGFPVPPPLDGDNARRMKDGQIFHLITMGRGNMPSIRAQLPPADRWKAILAVRAQFQATPAVAAPLGPESAR